MKKTTIAIVLISLCAICCTISIFINLLNPNPITSSSPTQKTIPLEEIIAQTSIAAQTQTAQALPTSTTQPIIQNTATATIFIFELQTAVAQPTQTLFSTNTPITLITVPAPNSEVCSCNGGLDCSNFNTHNQAQACFEYCKSLGYGDVHGIDGNDQDGLACESLP